MAIAANHCWCAKGVVSSTEVRACPPPSRQGAAGLSLAFGACGQQGSWLVFAQGPIHLHWQHLGSRVTLKRRLRPLSLHPKHKAVFLDRGGSCCTGLNPPESVQRSMIEVCLLRMAAGLQGPSSHTILHLKTFHRSCQG